MRVYPAVPPYSQNSLKKSTDTLATLPNYVSDVDLEKKGGDEKKSKSLSTLLAGKSGKRNQHGSLISVASGEKRYIRWARQHRKCLRYCGVCLILFGVFNAVMFTVGIKWIANYVLNNLYPPTFDLAQYPLTSVQIGPVTDDDVRVKFRVPVPPGLPVSVSLQGAVAIEIYTCAPPESTVEEYYSRDINQQYTGSSNITHNRTAINPQHPQGRCDRQSELLVGLAESLTQSIDIPASGPNVFAEMELLLRVPASSGRAFEFLVSNILSAERSTAIRNSSNTTLPSGYETPLDASNVTIFDSQLLDTTTIRIQMTLPCIKVLFLCIYDLQVDKYVLLQGKYD